MDVHRFLFDRGKSSLCPVGFYRKFRTSPTVVGRVLRYAAEYCGWEVGSGANVLFGGAAPQAAGPVSEGVGAAGQRATASACAELQSRLAGRHASAARTL